MRTSPPSPRVTRARAQIDQRRRERRTRRERVVDVQRAVAPVPALEPFFDPAPHLADQLAPALAQPAARARSIHLARARAIAARKIGIQVGRERLELTQRAHAPLPGRPPRRDQRIEVEQRDAILRGDQQIRVLEVGVVEAGGVKRADHAPDLERDRAPAPRRGEQLRASARAAAWSRPGSA